MQPAQYRGKRVFPAIFPANHSENHTAVPSNFSWTTGPNARKVIFGEGRRGGGLVSYLAGSRESGEQSSRPPGGIKSC